MECKKCNIEVPAQFEFALAKNICPKCGNKLMADQAMKVYLDLKKRLHEVEFVMDKATVCERIAMFMISNYEVMPVGGRAKEQSSASVEVMKQQLAGLERDDDLTPDEIRAQEAQRAEELAVAREMGFNVDDIDGDEELVTGIDQDRVERLKKLAQSGKSGVMVRRTE